MMITSITRSPGRVFLATLLVTGIIALSYPSFMVGAQAQQYYGMYDYKDPIVEVEKLKCNNDNFNIDSTNPQVLSDVAQKILSLYAQEGTELGAAADNSDQYSLDENFVFSCTNDNNDVEFPVSQTIH